MQTDPKENQVAFFIGYHDLYGIMPDLDQIRALIAPYNVDIALQFITAVNNQFCSAPRVTTENRARQELLIRRVFDDDTQKRLAASWFADDPTCLVFHRQQQLFLARMVFATCPVDGGLGVDANLTSALATACLMVNDLLKGERWSREPATEDEGLLTAAIQLMPIIEIGSDHNIQDVVGRALQLWVELPDQLMRKEKKPRIDIAALFESHFGVTLDAFLRVLYLVYVKVLSDSQSESLQPNAFSITVDHFVNVAHDPVIVGRVLDVLSRPIEEIDRTTSQRAAISAFTDFADLQRHPLVKLPSEVNVAFDIELLLKFFTHGVWMCIEEAIGMDNRSRRDDFRAFFGRVFERYCVDVLKHTYNARPFGHALVVPARFGSADEISDAIVDAKESWILLEAKGVLIRPEIKHGRDLDAAIDEINYKFVGNDDSRKAVKQLASSIRRLLDGARPTMGDLDIGRVDNIYPVLVCYDVAVGGKILAMYLERKFREALGAPSRFKPCVRPLTVFTVVDLEMFTSVGNQRQLSHLLASFRNGPPLITFRNYVATSHQDAIRQGDSYTVVNHEMFHTDMANDFTATD